MAELPITMNDSIPQQAGPGAGADELQPCPFCGGNATAQIGLSASREKRMCVVCQRCGASSETFCGEAHAQLLAAWNRRALLSHLAAPLAVEDSRERCASSIRVAAEQARVALKLCLGALMEMSPCAEPECKQTQLDWMEAAERRSCAALASLEAALAAQPEQQQGLVAASPAAPQQPEADFDDPRVQTVYNLLCADEAPPKDSNEHWEGWLARRIVDALAASPAAAAQQSITKEQALESLSEVGLWLSRDPHALRLRQFIEQASPAAAAAAAAGVPDGVDEAKFLRDFERNMNSARPVAPVGAPTEAMAVLKEWMDAEDALFEIQVPNKIDKPSYYAACNRAYMAKDRARALLSRQGCELATDATKQIGAQARMPTDADLEQWANSWNASAGEFIEHLLREFCKSNSIHLAATPIDQDFQMRPASSEAAPSAEGSLGNECNRNGG